MAALCSCRYRRVRRPRRGHPRPAVGCGRCDGTSRRQYTGPAEEETAPCPIPKPCSSASPVVPDLERIKKAGHLGPLANYLSVADTGERRIDLRNDRETVLNGVRPDASASRWPSEVGKPLAVSQQFAVNTILTELADGGLFAVNGPPGTGKLPSSVT